MTSGSPTSPAPAPVPVLAPDRPASPRRRYAVVGTGHRAGLYVSALTGAHADQGEIVAWVEPNAVRARYHDEQVTRETGAGPRPVYGPDDLERAIAEQRVDRVIVTTPDHAHADLVSRALRAGADVVVEKPIATDEAEARRIVDAVAETGRDLTMTFNYRYAPRNAALREVVASGEIGDVLAIHFDWALDTVHGADYFRRWHRDKRRSGGLLVHKSSHHFDLVSWWIDDAPRRVVASGGRRFYGHDGAHVREASTRPGTGVGQEDTAEARLRAEGIDPWRLDLAGDERLAALYGPEARAEDGYVRDADVFDEGIGLEDTLAVLVEYERGAVLTYSLVAHAPYEGYRVVVTGTRGRAELEVVERGSVAFGDDGVAVLDPTATPGAWDGDTVRPYGERLVVQKHWERAVDRPIPEGVGGHGGGDVFLLADVFDGPAAHDPLGRAAGYRDGIRASAVGYAANRSLTTGLPVTVADLDLGVELRRAHHDPHPATTEETPA
ncbi:Gfo/Idh/MocA family protein [Oerskovia flava]|uniref:Gfo/Idh/MocA family protein n=1 Tax=Oerskovia flava TaxID=2986422 RepID=UPI00223FD4ED|nr:Gfo/Idh/MocA family oxidoreductase [Oerskovia sp. JB1-3-2]